MHKPRVRVFRDKEKLYEMIELRLNGWNLLQLSRRFTAHHTSVLHWCEVFGLVGPRFSHSHRTADERRQLVSVTIQMGFIPIPPPPSPRVTLSTHDGKWEIDENGDRICTGKKYSEYIEDISERRDFKIFKETKDYELA